MELSARDYKKILDIIDVIYSIPDKNALFRAFFEKLRTHIGLCGAVFAPIDPQTGLYYSTGYEVINNPEAAMISYLDHYVTMDPFITCQWYRNANTAGRNTDLVPERLLLKSEFACDFLFPMNIFYILACSLVTQGDLVGTCGFHRQKADGDFSNRDKEFINILLPHLARAIRNIFLLQNVELRKEPAGVIMTGQDGKPFYQNETAKQALKGLSAKSLPDPGLGSAPVFFTNGAKRYRLRTLPLWGDKKGKLILLERYPPDHHLMTKLDGSPLSPREKEISLLAMQGNSNREIAEQLFICEQTVKDHLHSVFTKLDLRNRSELTAQVLGLRQKGSPAA